jgi:hypothetical protein
MTMDIWTQANRSRAALGPGGSGLRDEVRLTKFSEGAG